MQSRLPTFENLDALAGALGLPKQVLTSYVFDADRYYKRFRVGKRAKHGYRVIQAPSKELKGVQRWILAFILRQVPVSSNCTGFRPGASIVVNAEPHISQDFVFNADIRDFFPTITVNRVVGLYKHLGYPSEVAFGLGRLTTYRGTLPQGAPTSPDTANLICRNLDKRIAGLCARRSWVYTRYCDDITISGDHSIGHDADLISLIIRDEGFDLNNGKTRVLRRNARQMVTGLVVNESPNIERHRRKVWRAIFHQARLEPQRFVHRIPELTGYIGLLKMVRPEDPALTHYRKVLQTVKSATLR